jgi:hypothetical protein
MQTAALSRRVQNIVAKSRRRHAPRQSVASHNQRSCLPAAGAGAPGATWPEASSLRRAHIPVRVPSPTIAALRVDRAAPLRPVHRHALARVLRTPTELRARYAPTQEHWRSYIAGASA